MLDFPILNVRLNPCPEDWRLMTPTVHGRHCSSCNRTVVDFTTATQTDLDAARAAVSDGHLCGRFRMEQVAIVQPQLRPKLRRFLVALVLVCGLGLTSGEAWAQSQPIRRPASIPLGSAGVMLVEVVPTYRGGFDKFLSFIQVNQIWPDSLRHIQGKVFVEFVVDTLGSVHEPRVLKGLHPQLDSEAVRLVCLMQFSPARLNGKPVAFDYLVQVAYPPSPPSKRRQLFRR